MKRSHKAAGLLAALGLVAGACGDDSGGDDDAGTTDTTFSNEGDTIGEQEEATAAYGGRIVVGLEGESATWTPGESELTSGGLTVANAIYDPLIGLNDNGEYTPYLAANLDLAAGGTLVADGATVTGPVSRAVIGAGATVAGEVSDAVVWPGGVVAAGERLACAVRVGTEMTVPADTMKQL